MPTMRRDGYLEVGPTCTPFESDITIDEADELRRSVVWDYFDNMPVKTRALTETSDKTMVAVSFHDPDELSADQLPHMFAGAILSHTDLESWRMVITQAYYRRARHNNAQQRISTRFAVEVYDGQLVEAVRRVRVVRGVGDLTVAAIEKQMEEDVEEGHIVMQRRAYERYLNSDDCERAVDFLSKAVKRRKVS
jgi:hypothetical protein